MKMVHAETHSSLTVSLMGAYGELLLFTFSGTSQIYSTQNPQVQALPPEGAQQCNTHQRSFSA